MANVEDPTISYDEYNKQKMIQKFYRPYLST